MGKPHAVQVISNPSYLRAVACQQVGEVCKYLGMLDVGHTRSRLTR